MFQEKAKAFADQFSFIKNAVKSNPSQIINSFTAELKDMLFYNQTCLTERTTSDGFLHDVSDFVNCADLYSLKRTCYYDDSCEYCPVQLEIQDKQLQDVYKGRVLLQVWDKQGHKRLEKVFQELLKLWKIMGDILIYKPHPKDKQSEYYHIIDLENMTLIKVKEVYSYLEVTHIAYYNQVLIIGTESYIKLVDLSHADIKKATDSLTHPCLKEITIETIDETKITEIDFFYKNSTPNDRKSYILQGLFLFKERTVIALECEDNQIDFSYLDVTGRENGAIQYRILQTNEILKRSVRYDPILKFVFAIHNNRFFGCSMRRSKNIDLYRDLMKVETAFCCHVTDIDMGFEYGYMLLQGGESKRLSFQNERFSMALCEDHPFSESTFKRSISNINLFTAIIALNQNIFIAHGCILSIYDVFKKQWVDHFVQEMEVLTIFRQINEQGHYQVGIVLIDGTIKVMKTSDNRYYETWKFNSPEKKRKSQQQSSTPQNQTEEEALSFEPLKAKGKIIKTIIDKEMDYYFLLITKETFGHKLLAFQNNQLVDVKLVGLDIDVLISYKYILPLWGEANKLICCSPGDQNLTVLALEEEGQDVSLKLVTDEKALVEPIPKFDEEGGIIHTALTNCLDNMICLINNKDIIIQEFNTKEVTIYEAHVIKIYYSDNRFMYCFTQNHQINRCVFSIIDLESTIQTNILAKYDLYTLELNQHNSLDYDKFNNRFVYFSTFGEVNITPPLHKNNFGFFGMAEREIYVCFKQIKDKFFAIDWNNNITTWSAITGKKLFFKKADFDIDLTQYEVFNPEIYSQGYYTKVLIIKKEAEENFDESAFFESNGFQYESTLAHQVTFNQALGKKFHEFRLIELESESKIVEHFRFIHPKYDTQQIIYFNTKNDQMLEVIKGDYSTKAIMYESNFQEGNQKHVNWRITRPLDNFPQELLDQSYYPYYFSPDFTYYLDFNPKEKHFVIRHSKTQIEKGIIPKDLIGDDEDLRTKAKKIMFFSEDQLITISKEGIEKKFQVFYKDDHQIHSQDTYFKDVTQYTIPYFQNSDSHYYADPVVYDTLDIIQRLQQKYLNLRRTLYLHQRRDKTSIYEQLFTVNMLDQNNKPTIKPYIDMSFTYLDWNVIEKLALNQVQIESISEQQLIQLIFNILPNCETALHKVYRNSEVLEKLLKLSLSGDESTSIMDIPFIKNLNNKSPLHICVDEHDQKSINIILKELSIAHLDHHSAEIVDVLPQLIQSPTPTLLEYLDMRFVQTEWAKSQKRGGLRMDEGKNYATMKTGQWVWQSQFEKEIYDPEAAELPIIVEFLDLPALHCYQEAVSNDFFEALGESECLEIFQKRSIRQIIEFKFPLVREWTVKKLLFPYVVYLISYTFYANTINPKAKLGDPMHVQLSPIMKIILLALSFYFFRNEYTQFKLSGIQYFYSFWNYIDIVPPTFIPFLIMLEIVLFGVETQFLSQIYALVAFFMWFKFLYFFRIFKQTGYLIRMIVEVISDMRAFLVVLTICIVAFANAFLILSLENEEEQQFVTSFTDSIIYAYRMSLGDFDTEFGDKNTFLSWTLFLIGTVFNLIVMFNLLIAIISETFAKVQENAISCMYQEMATIIAENRYLIPDYKILEHCEKNKYLLFARNTDEQEEQQSQESQKLDELKTLMTLNFDKLLQSIQELKPQEERLKVGKKATKGKKGVKSNKSLKQGAMGFFKKLTSMRGGESSENMESEETPRNY